MGFGDLDQLMQKATELVSIMSKYSEILANKKREKVKESSSSSNNEEETKEALQLEEMLLQIGISNPITKQAVGGDGGAYLREIAHEINDFLSTDFNQNGLSLLMEKGGIMTLQDVYCMYNRARGTNLISPGDMVEACQIMNSLNLPIELFQYKTGVKVLQSRNYSTETNRIPRKRKKGKWYNNDDKILWFPDPYNSLSRNECICSNCLRIFVRSRKSRQNSARYVGSGARILQKSVL